VERVLILLNLTMKKINVAIAGIWSFAKALVEGVSFYTKNPNETVGLMNPLIWNYRVEDINFVAGFDVDERKVGKKLSEAISMGANVTKEITKPIEYEGLVYRWPTFDGIVDQMKGTFVHESNLPVADVSKMLKDNHTDILINLIPSWSNQATYFYAQSALEAWCSFINLIPTPLATLPEWRKKFEKKWLVLLGDDNKSQLGATMLNRLILEFLKIRGIKLTKSDQENRGSNADHFNLLYRAESKEKSKREALSTFLEKDDAKPTVKFFYEGNPSGHKLVKLFIEWEMFGRVPIVINATIEDEISINGAGTAVDAIRTAQLLVDEGKQKDAPKVCSFLMKSSSKPMSDSKAYKVFKKTIGQNL